MNILLVGNRSRRLGSIRDRIVDESDLLVKCLIRRCLLWFCVVAIAVGYCLQALLLLALFYTAM